MAIEEPFGVLALEAISNTALVNVSTGRLHRGAEGVHRDQRACSLFYTGVQFYRGAEEQRVCWFCGSEQRACWFAKGRSRCAALHLCMHLCLFSHPGHASQELTRPASDGYNASFCVPLDILLRFRTCTRLPPQELRKLGAANNKGLPHMMSNPSSP